MDKVQNFQKLFKEDLTEVDLNVIIRCNLNEQRDKKECFQLVPSV